MADELSPVEAEMARHALDRPCPTPYQARVGLWMAKCFGAEISGDVVERCDRFLEEALELVQAIGHRVGDGWAGDDGRARAHALVDYVFGRRPGHVGQEVGGVRVTLAALCNAADMSEDREAEAELARIWTKVPEIRAKQAAKPRGSALPVAGATDDGTRRTLHPQRDRPDLDAAVAAAVARAAPADSARQPDAASIPPPAAPALRCGDVVRHEPSGEEWVVAYADPARDDLAVCGWPADLARLSECRLVSRAPDREFLRIYDALAGSGHRESGSRRLYAAEAERVRGALDAAAIAAVAAIGAAGAISVGWIPADYLDEVTPPPRPSPDAWIVDAGAGFALDRADPLDVETPPERLAAGEIVQFVRTAAWPRFEVIRTADGWRGPAMPADADQVWEPGDTDTICDSIETLIEGLSEGDTLTVEPYAFSDPIDFRAVVAGGTAYFKFADPAAAARTLGRPQPALPLMDDVGGGP